MAEFSHDLRNLSLSIIIDVLKDGKYLNTSLNECFEKNSDLDKIQRAFIARLASGTVEQVIFIDYVLEQFVKAAKKQRPVIINILRMSAYQILFMDSVPDSAACNEAVKLVKKRGLKNLSGFVNGVLRNVSREKDSIILPDKDKEYDKYLSVKYSMPLWLAQHFLSLYDGGETEEILKWFTEDKSLYVRCNTSKADTDEIIKMLREDGISAEKNKYIDYALMLENIETITALRAFKKGYIQVQDIASMLPGYILPVKEGDTIIDVCAAPGGKSLHAADKLNNTGRVISCDISAAKVAKIEENVTRCGFANVFPKVQDALVKDDELINGADIVIADLPCSGLGIIGRKPDIKYNITKEAIDELAKLQRNILATVWEYVKPGGYLMYSTCTVTAQENVQNYEWILKNLPFEPVPLNKLLPDGIEPDAGYIQMIPGEHGTDGFFVALFKRKSEDV